MLNKPPLLLSSLPYQTSNNKSRSVKDLPIRMVSKTTEIRPSKHKTKTADSIIWINM